MSSFGHRYTIGIAAFVLVLGWSYWPTLQFLLGKWTDDPQYSHGFLVPLVAGYLGYRRFVAGQLKLGTPRPLLALLLLALTAPLRWLAGGLMFHPLDAVTLIFSLAALALLVGGAPTLRGLWQSLVFLIFLVPLPYELERNIGAPLKLIAVEASTFLLQVLGQPAISEGNLILIDDVRLGVVDACSGLKMLMTFSAFAVGAVFLTDRTWFEKSLILLGVLPIAVVVNVLRIVATGIAYTQTDDKVWLNWLHDVHGYLMMPAGLGLLAAQLSYLNRLVIRPTTSGPNATTRADVVAGLFR